MEQYIKKSAVVAEIKKRIKGLKDCNADTVAGYAGEISGLESLLSFLDTLEVKEVDLEKEIQDLIYNRFFDLEGIAIAGSSLYATVEDMAHIARHFFELGLNTRKNKILTKEEKLHLPSGVDEAAKEHVRNVYNDINKVFAERVAACKFDFKAGAEWMAGQGETLYDTINVDGKNQRWLGENLLQGDYDAGQAVIVQIRKV